jgi:glycerol-3-phosphate dehydrogenase
MSVPRTTIICQIAVFRVLSHGYIVHVVSDTENDTNIPVSDSLNNVNKSIEHERDNVPYAYHLVNGQNLNATEMLASILDTEKHVVQNIPKWSSGWRSWSI